MSIQSVGGNASDSNYQIRRKQMELERENELDRIETRYNEERKGLAEARSESLKKNYERQEDEINRIRSDTNYKISGAQSHADAQLKKFQEDTQRITAEAGRTFREKASQLDKLEKEMKFQQDRMNDRHMEALRIQSKEQELSQTNAKARAQSEMSTLDNEYQKRTLQLQAQNKNNLEKAELEGREQLAKSRADTDFQLTALKNNQKRLAEELQLETEAQRARHFTTMNQAQKQYASQFEALQSKQLAETSELQRKHDHNIRAFNYRGEQEVTDLHNRFNDEKQKTTVEENKKINDIRTRSNKAVELTAQQYSDDLKRMERDYFKKRTDLEANYRASIAENEAKSKIAKEQSDIGYVAQSKAIRDKRDATIKGLNETLVKDMTALQEQADKQFEAQKLANTVRTANHAARSSDPFYKLQNIAASVSETENGFLVEIEAPEHEKDNFKVLANHTNKGITISGNRRSEINATPEPGHSISTNSYQSFSESMPLTAAVDLRKMTKTYDNGRVRFYLPKA